MNNKIPIGVSSCLIGEKVRWNGDHKQNHYVMDVLGNYFEWVPVCPEMAVGMGVPRETVNLSGTPEAPRMLGSKTGQDWTSVMNRFSQKKVQELEQYSLCGYIFKARSPSCGMDRIPVYKEPGSQIMKRGRGLFADAFMKANPLVPVEEEGRLNDFKLRENFIVRVFSFHRLQELFRKNLKRGDLVRFHTNNKFLLLAHSRKHYDLLGRMVADIKKMDWKEVRQQYCQTFMEALTYKTTPKKNADVLIHMMGFFKKDLNSGEKKQILNSIEEYRKELLPLIVPVTLIRYHVEKYQVEYLQDQVYLNPHPKELMLRNHV